MKRMVVFLAFLFAFCAASFADDFSAITLDSASGMFLYQGEKLEKITISAGQYIWEINSRDTAEVIATKTDKGTLLTFKLKNGDYFQLYTWQMAISRKRGKEIAFIAG